MPKARAKTMVTIRRIVIPNVIKTASPEKMRYAYPGLLLQSSSARTRRIFPPMFGPPFLVTTV